MRITTLPEKRYPLFIRMIFRAQKRKYGNVLEPTKVWGLSPKLLFGLQIFYRMIDRKRSPIEPALRSLVSVRVSQINHCPFCVDINSALLRERGVSMEKILALAEFDKAQVFSEREKASLAYAEAITKNDKGVSPETFATLRKHFSEEEIVELTAVIAYQNLSSKFNAALDIPSQGFCMKESDKK